MELLAKKQWFAFSLLVVCHAGDSLGDQISEETCGKSRTRVRRVIAGDNASLEEWPWQAWFHIDHVGFTCGGSLIAREWVVTAAHCILSDDPSLYRVTLGDVDRNIAENTEQVFGVKEIIKHQNFSKCFPYNYDIALLHLSRPAQLNRAVTTICLPQLYQGVPPGTECHMTGWGKVFPGSKISDVLQDAPVATVSNPTCAAKLAKAPEKGLRHDSRTWKVTDNMVCAGDAGKTNISGCYGDSGGPLACKDTTDHWVLQGLVSWGDPDCLAHNHYTVFTRVSDFRLWIDSRGENTTALQYVCAGCAAQTSSFIQKYVAVALVFCFQTLLAP